MAPRVSAGILLYRRREGVLEVLLIHPGGPFFGRKDMGSWSIPKGLVDSGEDVRTTARREFEEEVGLALPDSTMIELGTVVQKGGKIVHAWAVEGDLDTGAMSSNYFELDWPPFSGKKKQIPEVDRWEYFGPREARARIKEAQIPLLERLEAALASAGSGASRDAGGGAGG